MELVQISFELDVKTLSEQLFVLLCSFQSFQVLSTLWHTVQTPLSLFISNSVLRQFSNFLNRFLFSLSKKKKQQWIHTRTPKDQNTRGENQDDLTTLTFGILKGICKAHRTDNSLYRLFRFYVFLQHTLVYFKWTAITENFIYFLYDFPFLVPDCIYCFFWLNFIHLLIIHLIQITVKDILFFTFTTYTQEKGKEMKGRTSDLRPIHIIYESVYR